MEGTCVTPFLEEYRPLARESGDVIHSPRAMEGSIARLPLAAVARGSAVCPPRLGHSAPVHVL